MFTKRGCTFFQYIYIHVSQNLSAGLFPRAVFLVSGPPILLFEIEQLCSFAERVQQLGNRHGPFRGLPPTT